MKYEEDGSRDLVGYLLMINKAARALQDVDVQRLWKPQTIQAIAIPNTVQYIPNPSLSRVPGIHIKPGKIKEGLSLQTRYLDPE